MARVQDSGSAIFTSCNLTKNSAIVRELFIYALCAIVLLLLLVFDKVPLPLLSSSSFVCSQDGAVLRVESSGSAIFTSCTLIENSGTVSIINLLSYIHVLFFIFDKQYNHKTPDI